MTTTDEMNRAELSRPSHQAWRYVWREGIAPQLSVACLQALERALIEDDPHLLQGATVDPPPLECVQDWHIEGGCPLALAGWKGHDIETVGELSEWFSHVCYVADNKLGEPAGVRHFINWVDETPRKDMIAQLLAEVSRTLSQRALQE